MYKKKWYIENKEDVKQYGKDNIVKTRLSAKKYQQKHRDENPEIYSSKEYKEKMRYLTIKSKYGITSEDYNAMFLKQEGKCEICKIHQSNINRTLVIDHCHATNKVRALLCHKCNLAIGLMNESIESLKSAMNYINKWTE